METEQLVADTLHELGLEIRPAPHPTDARVDVVVEPNGVQVRVQLRRRALVDVDTAERLLAETNPAHGALLVVADRVTDGARKALMGGRAGYLDLRGHVALRTNRLVINCQVTPWKGRGGRSAALAGRAGLEVAAALLLQPSRSPTGRELAREVHRSASTVSEILSALREDGMIDQTNAVTSPHLFWQVAERWPTRRTYLAQRPPAGDASLTLALRMGFNDVENEPGWALTDSAAAAAYGAPLAFRLDQSLDFFVPDEQTVRRAVNLLGEARSPSTAAATVRSTPVPAVVRRRVDLPSNPTEWPLAHPLFVALDLAHDVGRGREILDAWTPEGEWTRVW